MAPSLSGVKGDQATWTRTHHLIAAGVVDQSWDIRDLDWTGVAEGKTIKDALGSASLSFSSRHHGAVGRSSRVKPTFTTGLPNSASFPPLKYVLFAKKSVPRLERRTSNAHCCFVLSSTGCQFSVAREASTSATSGYASCNPASATARTGVRCFLVSLVPLVPLVPRLHPCSAPRCSLHSPRSCESLAAALAGTRRSAEAPEKTHPPHTKKRTTLTTCVQPASQIISQRSQIRRRTALRDADEVDIGRIRTV